MYKTVYRRGESRFVEKKSEFITYVDFVRTKAAAEAFIADVKERYPDATHHCSAYIVHKDRSVQKYDDDGEPQKTAGPPILEVLKRNDLTNVVCVVTRYFGGTLLGAGGLIRAYSTGAAEAVNDAVVVTMYPAVDITFRYDYTDHGSIENYMMQNGFPILDTVYTDRVEVTTTVYQNGRDAWIHYLNDATSGEVVIVEENETERAVYRGELLYNGKGYRQKNYEGEIE
ncbi:MAG: YigZ family protein [Peptoniphilus sp.]|nr:YigZ family protein [Peptoniphilus sp.]MDD7363122.1 YigZ family protein [Bacillota bacterium]MDY6044356.1 YigZ family protein [Peptoniphilus sp.]